MFPFVTMFRRTSLHLLTLVLILAASALPAAAKPARVKLATLAPKGTSFHLILQEMAQGWKTGPDGGVAVTMFTDGTMGGESDMVRRMRLGQLHAGLITTAGLGDIEGGVSGLQNIPMAYRSLDEVEHVLAVMAPKYEQKMYEKGFVVLGWFDSGWINFFSKKPLIEPADLRGEKVFVIANSPGTVEVVRELSMQPVVLEPTDILVSLQTGLITVVTAPPFYGLAGQFYQPAPHFLPLNWAPLVGGLVITRKVWDDLSPAQQELLKRTGTEACQKIRTAARAEMLESITAMESRGLIVHKIDTALEKKWIEFFDTVQPKTRGTVVPADDYDAIMGTLATHRANHPAPAAP
ncbi:MAG: TRAP transporter substrate-binding protein DctP [Opitutaceae bacterium]|nr:TRAP transporter substrate-binding protein DctP [Opitutaceae bacterium]